MTNAEIFINKNKELEQIIRTEYNLRNNEDLEIESYDKRFNKLDRQNLRMLRNIRNILQHQNKINDKYIIEPISEIIEIENQLIQKYKKEQRCYDKCIKKSKIYLKNIDDEINDNIKKMKLKSYTHIPILKDEKIVGVFDENSIFNYLADETIIEIDKTFKDIENYISLENRETEEYKFISKEYTIKQLKEDMEKSKDIGKRLDIAFITEHGKKEEKLLGLITIWDIINLE